MAQWKVTSTEEVVYVNYVEAANEEDAEEMAYEERAEGLGETQSGEGSLDVESFQWSGDPYPSRREPSPPHRPVTVCGCGYALVWCAGHWEHDAAPYLWGDDHSPDAPPAADNPARVYWDNLDGGE